MLARSRLRGDSYLRLQLFDGEDVFKVGEALDKLIVELSLLTCTVATALYLCRPSSSVTRLISSPLILMRFSRMTRTMFSIVSAL